MTGPSFRDAELEGWDRKALLGRQLRVGDAGDAKCENVVEARNRLRVGARTGPWPARLPPHPSLTCKSK
jgi:hypothetical protein